MQANNVVPAAPTLVAHMAACTGGDVGVVASGKAPRVRVPACRPRDRGGRCRLVQPPRWSHAQLRSSPTVVQASEGKLPRASARWLQTRLHPGPAGLCAHRRELPAPASLCAHRRELHKLPAMADTQVAVIVVDRDSTLCIRLLRAVSASVAIPLSLTVARASTPPPPTSLWVPS